VKGKPTQRTAHKIPAHLLTDPVFLGARKGILTAPEEPPASGLIGVLGLDLPGEVLNRADLEVIGPPIVIVLLDLYFHSQLQAVVLRLYVRLLTALVLVDKNVV